MTKLELTNYQDTIEDDDFAVSFHSLKTLYDLADRALADIANQVDDDEKILNLEKKFLSDKERFINLAAKVQCKDINDISQKLDFLNRVYLEEKSLDDLSSTDVLLKSICEDSQIYC